MDRAYTYNLDEVKTITNITLERDWDIFFTGFIQGIRFKHKDSCLFETTYKNQDIYDEDLCNCNPEKIDIIIGKLIAYPKAKQDTDNKLHYQCTIPEYLEEVGDKDWKLPVEAFPTLLKEDLSNGLCTLVEMLKVYEKTGSKNYDFFKVEVDNKIIEGRELQNLLYT